jgi:hypothetical protein
MGRSEAVNEGRDRLWIAAVAATLLLVYGVLTRHGPALADEFVYLAGAKHFARTASLDARFYDAMAILRRGYPHQDVHAPGYVLLLGSLTALLTDGYWTAVALNVAAYVSGAFLVRALARSLGFPPRTAVRSALLFLILPPYLPFVFWAMPEVLLGALFLASLVVALRWGATTGGAVAAGVLMGLGILVRETLLLGVLAVARILWIQRRAAPFLAGVGLFVLLVQVPLSRNRAPGGVNFWAAEVPKRPGAAFAAVQTARRGDVLAAVDGAWRRLESNVRWFRAASATEKGILILYVVVPALALGRRRSGTLADRVRPALAAVAVAMMVAVVFLSVVTRWSGFRYLMFVIPPFLPWIVTDREGAGRLRTAIPVAVAAACLLLEGSVLRIHNGYKTSRQRRWNAVTAYVERYVGDQPLLRIVLPNGWAFGLKRYPTEVISSLPRQSGHLRHLERAVWFDYLVLPADSPFASESDARRRYVRLNADDAEAPLKVYRRLH